MAHSSLSLRSSASPSQVRNHGSPFSRRPRFLTEEEWEYAARAGQETLYAGSDRIDEVAWTVPAHVCPGAGDWSKFDGLTIYPVATRAPNAWGFYDMSGGGGELAWSTEVKVIGPVNQCATLTRADRAFGLSSVARGGPLAAGLRRALVFGRGQIANGLRLARNAPE